jgi:hypothetical protein
VFPHTTLSEAKEVGIEPKEVEIEPKEVGIEPRFPLPAVYTLNSKP